MIKVIFGIENPFVNLIDWMNNIPYEGIRSHRTKVLYDFMRYIAEDVEFEEIETVHEDREIEIIIQGVE